MFCSPEVYCFLGNADQCHSVVNGTADNTMETATSAISAVQKSAASTSTIDSLLLNLQMVFIYFFLWTIRLSSASGNSASGRPRYVGIIVLTIHQTAMK